MARKKKHAFDQTDYRLAEALLRDPDIGLIELGKLVGLGKTAAGERRDFLLDEGYLVHSYTVGRSRSAWTQVRLLQIKLDDRSEEIVEKLRVIADGIAEVSSAYTAHGDVDAFVWVETATGDRFEEIRRIYQREFGNVVAISIIQTLKPYRLDLSALESEIND